MSRPNNLYFWFYLHKCGNCEPLYLSKEVIILKIKEVLLVRFLRTYHNNFKYLPWTESIEVTGPTIGGLHIQKSLFSGIFLGFFFSETAHELMVPA